MSARSTRPGEVRCGRKDDERPIAVGDRLHDRLDDFGPNGSTRRGSAFGSRVPTAGFCEMTRSAVAARKIATTYR